MQSAFEKYRGEAFVAFSLPAIRKMQMDVGRPFCIVLLVDVDVVAVPLNKRFGGALDLNPCICRDDIVVAELWIVYKNAQLVLAFTAFHWNSYLKVVVVIPDEWNFDIVSAEFLLDLVFTVDGVFEEPAAFDFPAVVDAAACGEACGDTRDDDSYGELREPCGSCSL